MDIQKLAYDLSLVYATVQYTQALTKGTLPIASDHPQYLEDSSFLTKAFTDMYLELLNSPGLFEEIGEWEPRLLDKEE